MFIIIVWNISLALAFMSIAIMAVLIVRRVVIEHLNAKREAQRKILNSALIRFGADGDRARLAASLSELSRPVIADAGFEFLSMVRGDERRRIEEVFADIGIPDLIRKQLRTRNRAKRIYAAENLVAFPGEETTQALLAALKERSRQVRIAAAISLGKLGELPPLREVISSLGFRAQRSGQIIEVFQTLGPDRADELREIAMDPMGYVPLRAAAIHALGKTGVYDHLPFLTECARSRSPEIASAAVNALGQMAHPSAAAAIRQALNHPDWTVRAEAARAAGLVGVREASARLAELLDDEEWTVRYSAASSLRSFGETGIEQLRQLAVSGPPRSQRTASMVIAEGAT